MLRSQDTGHAEMTDSNMRHRLTALAGIYCAASLAHFVHNAEFLADYPNMPAWLSRLRVYVAWLAITAVGAIALALSRSRHALAGLVLLAVYAALGFDGLGHYALAPLSSHTFAMNLTIWCEVAAASLLLVFALHGILDAGRQLGT
jgi:hypothetical protein